MTKSLAIGSLLMLSLHSCKEDNASYDPYYNWQSRNAKWFASAVDSAKTAISQSENSGEECEWRLYKSIMYSHDYEGNTDDYIVCKVLRKGNGTFSPKSNDSVSIHFKGWLMPTDYISSDGKKKETSMFAFTQTYYGDTINTAIAKPQLMSVAATVEGFQLALQHMVEGDDWMIYIPAKIAYKGDASSVIPAYSTLLYRIYMVGAYKSGTGQTPLK